MRQTRPDCRVGRLWSLRPYVRNIETRNLKSLRMVWKIKKERFLLLTSHVLYLLSSAKCYALDSRNAAGFFFLHKKLIRYPLHIPLRSAKLVNVREIIQFFASNGK